MQRFLQLGVRFVRDEDGATMIEYAIMLGLIAGVCIGAVTVIGTKTEGLFQSNSQSVAKALGGEL